MSLLFVLDKQLARNSISSGSYMFWMNFSIPNTLLKCIDLTDFRWSGKTCTGIYSYPLFLTWITSSQQVEKKIIQLCLKLDYHYSISSRKIISSAYTKCVLETFLLLKMGLTERPETLRQSIEQCSFRPNLMKNLCIRSMNRCVHIVQ